MLSLTFASRRYITSMAPATIQTAAKDFLSFVNASPTPYHAVRGVKDRLSGAGFKEIKERDSWSSTCVPGGKYYLTRNGSTIVAFAIGKKWRPGNPIAMAGSHTDSPCLKIKPVSKKQSEGYLHVGVECYGGGIWHTWFDRDLGMAGRVMVENSAGEIEQKLVHIDKPLFRIPTLAIHFGREESFKFSKESQLFPIAGLISAEIKRQDEQKKSEDNITDAATEEESPLKPITQRHHSQVIDLIAADIGTTPEKIVDFDITLYDVQPACLGGLSDEFIYSARLDNLNQTYCLATGFIESLEQSSALEDESAIRLLACFDHEEIGSMTAQGAFSFMLPAIVRRLSVLPASSFSGNESDADMATAYEQTLATSFLLSADMAHAVHPNYTEKHESNHKCDMNKGPVIKVNANARYATNAPGIALLQEVARRAPKKFETDKAGVPLQLFVVRNDSLCGSTIGPMLSAHLGVRTLDLGNPQLSMHSCREIGGTDDVHHAIRLFTSFYQEYSKLEKTILVD